MNILQLRDALTKLIDEGHEETKVLRYTEEVLHKEESASYIAVYRWKEVLQGKLDEDGLKLI